MWLEGFMVQEGKRQLWLGSMTEESRLELQKIQSSASLVKESQVGSGCERVLFCYFPAFAGHSSNRYMQRKRVFH